MVPDSFGLAGGERLISETPQDRLENGFVRHLNFMPQVRKQGACEGIICWHDQVVEICVLLRSSLGI